MIRAHDMFGKPVYNVDLFGSPLRPRVKHGRPHAAALEEVVLALRTNSAVAWCEVMRTGATKIGDRFVRFGFPGLSDVIGQLRDGRFLAVEVKVPPDDLTIEQSAFLALVRANGGVAFVARDLRDVRRELDAAWQPTRLTT